MINSAQIDIMKIMRLTIPQDVQKRIEDRMKSGQYATPGAVIAAALLVLENRESLGKFAPGELKKLIAEGERGGPSISGEQVFKGIREFQSGKRAG